MYYAGPIEPTLNVILRNNLITVGIATVFG
jgi:hypothetical protein